MKSEQEIQLSDDLRQIVAGQPFGPDVEAIARRGHRVRRRSTVIRGAAALGAAAAGAAVVVSLVIPTPGTATGRATAAGRATAKSPGGPAGRAAPAATVAYETKQIETALGQADHYMIKTTTRSYGNGTYAQWTDPRTGSSYASQGTGSARVLSWNSTFFVARVLHWRTTEADYSTRTWFVSIIHAAGPIQGPESTGPDVPGGTPQQLRKGLQAGFYRITGHGQVNGHHAIRLRASLGPVTFTIWVDARTYQPVRVIKAFSTRKGDTLVFNETWLPRSPSLVSLANHPRIPAGFSHVAAPQ
jgi:hypothetical protein